MCCMQSVNPTIVFIACFCCTNEQDSFPGVMAQESHAAVSSDAVDDDKQERCPTCDTMCNFVARCHYCNHAECENCPSQELQTCHYCLYATCKKCASYTKCVCNNPVCLDCVHGDLALPACGSCGGRLCWDVIRTLCQQCRERVCDNCIHRCTTSTKAHTVDDWLQASREEQKKMCVHRAPPIPGVWPCKPDTDCPVTHCIGFNRDCCNRCVASNCNYYVPQLRLSEKKRARKAAMLTFILGCT